MSFIRTLVCLVFTSEALGFHNIVVIRPSSPAPSLPRNKLLPKKGFQWLLPPLLWSQQAADDTTADTTTAAIESSLLQAITFCNLDQSQEPQLLCDFLMEIGACSTSIVDADRDTDREVPWFDEGQQQQKQRSISNSADHDEPHLDDPWHNLMSSSNNPRIGVWPRCNVTAHFPASANLAEVMQLVHESLQISFSDSFSIERIPQRDWIVHVQQSWKPIIIGNLILRFPWHSKLDVEKAMQDRLQRGLLQNYNDMAQLQLEGGIAFGTGEHPTTQLCLEFIQDLIMGTGGSSEIIQTVLDYGAGSGVLGLAACATAPSTHPVTAIGVDIDVDAVRIANVNAATNRLNMTTYLPPLTETDDSESKSLLLKAHSHFSTDSSVQILPSQFQGPIFDVCVANILARPLVSLAPTLASFLRPGAHLGLSGILSGQEDMVLNEYTKFFDNLRVKKEQSGWVLITGLRKS